MLVRNKRFSRILLQLGYLLFPIRNWEISVYLCFSGISMIVNKNYPINELFCGKF